jgi:hypothetical protein
MAATLSIIAVVKEYHIMKYEDRFEKALRSDEPVKALNAFVFELAAEGCRKAEIYKFFEEFILYMRKNNSGREADEGLLMEVMDALTDWCHPSAQLQLPIYLEPDVAEFIQKYAKEKDVEADTIVNQWLRASITAMQ